MKQFKIGDIHYECDDKYTHAAMDENGLVFAFEEEPLLFAGSGYWDHHHQRELEPLQLSPVNIPEWKTTLVDI